MSIGLHCRDLLTFLLAVQCLFGASFVSAEEYFDKYGLVSSSPSVDLGVQPLGVPSGVISAVMRRDRKMLSALTALGSPLKTHAFKRGADMLGLLADHRLEAGLLGDVPTIFAASTGAVWIVGLVKLSSTAIVAGGFAQVRGLAGKRIAYVPVSSAHHTLLQGLASAGLSESDVNLIPMSVSEMPDALARGDVDAFAAWEPAPAVALAKSERNRIVFRGQSTDYFVIDREFEKKSPEAALVLVAGFARAIEWMRRSQDNVERAARWVLADGAALTGTKNEIPVAQIVAITRREILNVPSAPVIVSSEKSTPPLKNEFEFLRKLGKLPPNGSWNGVGSAFRYAGLGRILAEPRKYEVGVFDYAE